MPILFRGLSVEPVNVDRICSEIARTGKLRAEHGMYSGHLMADAALVRSRAAVWFQSPASIRDELTKITTMPLAYACGDRAGSAFYARRGTGVPLVVEFEVPWESMRVDGRDFLYTVFTLWDRDGASHLERVREALATLFGKAILKYFDQAKGTFKERIGHCDLAIHDMDVMRSHYSNSVEIEGRGQIRFHSSFQFLDPVNPEKIRSISKSVPVPPESGRQISLPKILTP
jgi:hypothetical protein